ncbi:hypothetical protein V2G26_019902 [Clonostachys chloroleuca]
MSPDIFLMNTTRSKPRGRMITTLNSTPLSSFGNGTFSRVPPSPTLPAPQELLLPDSLGRRRLSSQALEGPVPSLGCYVSSHRCSLATTLAGQTIQEVLSPPSPLALQPPPSLPTPLGLETHPVPRKQAGADATFAFHPLRRFLSFYYLAGAPPLELSKRSNGRGDFPGTLCAPT